MSLSLNYPTISPSLLLDFANSGRLDPQVTFTRASTATYFDESGVLRTANNDVPRFDYNPATLAAQGLLIEESRTNSIRNNTMQGAVAGTPGTLPTNWGVATGGLTGITREIVGTGTESGITYLDIKFSGTPSAAGTYRIYTETTTGLAALTGQTWTNSQYLKLAAGTTTGVGLFTDVYQEFTSGGVFITEAGINISSPTSNNLATQRSATTRTLSGGATTAFFRTGIQLSLTGAAIDITLRIGLPQLELGAFATSVIPTTTTALTRAADVASVNTLSPWFNSTASTIYAEWTNIAAAIPTGATQIVAEISEATSNNFYRIFQSQAANAKASTNMFSGGVNPGRIDDGGTYSNATVKAASAFAASDRALSANGGAAATSATGALPVGVTTLSLGQQIGGSNVINGWLRRITYYPRRLSNAELQAITS